MIIVVKFISIGLCRSISLKIGPNWSNRQVVAINQVVEIIAAEIITVSRINATKRLVRPA